MLAQLLTFALAFTGPVARPSAAGRASISMARKSEAVPFLPRPEHLAASLPGYAGFDPLNLATNVDIKWMQEAELKHGRLAMLAVVGFVATDLGLVAPGAPTGLSSVAAHDVAVQKGSMYVLLFFASLLEVAAGVPAVEQMMKGSGRKPGDFAFDLLHMSSGGGEAAKKLAVNEVKNGRLAMLAFSGIVTQAALTGHGFPYN